MTAIALGLAWAVMVAVALGPRVVPARLPHPDGPTLTTAPPLRSWPVALTPASTSRPQRPRSARGCDA